MSSQLEYYPIELLHWAGMNDTCLNEIEDILNKYPEYIHTQNQQKDNALIIATRTGNIGIVKYLVERTDIDINHCTLEGNALMIAIHYKKEEIALYLIEKGIALDIKNYKNHNSLFEACGIGNDNIIEVLLAKNVSINYVDNEKQNVFYGFMDNYLSHNNYYCFEIILSNLQTDILFCKDKNGNDIISYMDKLIEESKLQNMIRYNRLVASFEPLKAIILSLKPM